MIYVVGFVGLISGFALGMMVIARLLKNVSKDDLVHDRSIRWRYGILTWLFAGLGAYSFVKMYEYYFG